LLQRAFWSLGPRECKHAASSPSPIVRGCPELFESSHPTRWATLHAYDAARASQLDAIRFGHMWAKNAVSQILRAYRCVCFGGENKVIRRRVGTTAPMCQQSYAHGFA